MPYILYAIPNCDIVKKARVWLAGHGVDYQFHDYKKQGISRRQLEQWLVQKQWEELVNRAGTTWKKLPDADKPTNVESAIALMLEKPSAIRRPLFEADGKIILLGFSAEAYEAVLGAVP